MGLYFLFVHLVSTYLSFCFGVFLGGDGDREKSFRVSSTLGYFGWKRVFLSGRVAIWYV